MLRFSSYSIPDSTPISSAKIDLEGYFGLTPVLNVGYVGAVFRNIMFMQAQAKWMYCTT